MKTAVEVTINGEARSGEAEPRQSLADFVRDACGLTGTHLGCEHGVCGACTILLDGKPVRSCLVLAVQAGDGTVETVEGFADDPVMVRLRQAFSEHHALQCGFCTPGMLITARDIVVRLGTVDEARIRQELSGNICRCTGYEGIVRAIEQVAAENIVQPSRPAALTRPLKAVGKVVLPPRAKLSAPPAAPVVAAGDAITVEQQFETSHSLDRVWAFFADPNAVAACLPGAELVAVNGENISGRVQIKMGPIKAQFAGDVRYLRDDASKVGSVDGSGIDSISNSRVTGTLRFALAEIGANSTRVDLMLSFTLQGLLAQFSRPALVRDFVGFIVRQFAANLNAALSGGQVTPAKSLTVWAVAGWWFKRLFKSIARRSNT